MSILIKFLKKIKPLVVKFLRKIPLSDKILGIPKKRISYEETEDYFNKIDSDSGVLKIFNKKKLFLYPPRICNRNLKGYYFKHFSEYTCENFLIHLENARYNQRPHSIFTKENYHLAIASSHPELSIDEHIAFKKLFYSKAKIVKGTSLLLVTQDDANYYHCLFQIPAKIWFLKKLAFDFDSIDNFILNVNSSKFQREIIGSLLISHEKILDISNFKQIKLDNLIVTPTFCNPEPWMIPLLKDTFLGSFQSNAKEQESSSERIYISRNKASYRRILNENFLWSILERFGFKYIRTEGMTIREQAVLFAKAKIIVTAHGAALANTVFCQPGTKIFEIRAFQHDFLQYNLYEHLSSIADLKHYTLLVDGYPSQCSKNALTFDLMIEENQIEEIIEEFINDNN
ncbi:glycosyltransferase family 61 protein [Catalinimonas locisalis]|uniref:glycosyltransferase family 61 protein n=1 Tax=Catalinimonas locisalis TaxID=3133978 RepID=UPI0031013691